jgi:hypothetical protein
LSARYGRFRLNIAIIPFQIGNRCQKVRLEGLVGWLSIGGGVLIAGSALIGCGVFAIGGGAFVFFGRRPLLFGISFPFAAR